MTISSIIRRSSFGRLLIEIMMIICSRENSLPFWPSLLLNLPIENRNTLILGSILNLLRLKHWYNGLNRERFSMRSFLGIKLRKKWSEKWVELKSRIRRVFKISRKNIRPICKIAKEMPISLWPQEKIYKGLVCKKI